MFDFPFVSAMFLFTTRIRFLPGKSTDFSREFLHMDIVPLAQHKIPHLSPQKKTRRRRKQRKKSTKKRKTEQTRNTTKKRTIPTTPRHELPGLPAPGGVHRQRRRLPGGPLGHGAEDPEAPGRGAASRASASRCSDGSVGGGSLAHVAKGCGDCTTFLLLGCGDFNLFGQLDPGVSVLNR